MRILLIPPKSNYPESGPDIHMPGLGFPYLSAALKDLGHEVFGAGISYHVCPGGAKKYLEQTIKKAISEYQPELIGLGGLSADYLFVRDAIEIIRTHEPKLPIICGGGLYSGDIEYIFTTLHPDFAVIGEGERTLLLLVETLAKKQSPSDIQGIAFWRDGKMVLTGRAEPIANIDSLKTPDFNIYDLKSYFSILNHRDHHLNCRTKLNPRLLPVMASRSCPFACTFCFHTMGTKYRVRHIQCVIDEIIALHDAYQINTVYLYDELFSINRERVYLFCELLNKTKLDIHWTAMARVNDVDEDLLRTMKNAGCTHVSCGFESASPSIVRSMRKEIDPGQIRRAIEMADKAGIGIQAGFIYGDPEETPETISTTLDFFNRYCLDSIIHSFYVTPFPGSEVFSHCLKNNIIRDRKAYYETIHLRPVYNMTRMPYRTFHNLLDPIVRHRFTGFKKSMQTKFENLGHKDYLGRELFKITTKCPHCRDLVNYHYPIDINKESVPSLLNVLAPLELFCALCHKRFVISTLGLTGFEEEYAEYISGIQKLEKSFRPVVVTPVIGEIAMQNHRFYGFNWENLNLVGFMDPGGPDGTTFCGYPSLALSQDNVLRRLQCDFIVAPHDNMQKYITFLTDCGVPPENLHYFEIKNSSRLDRDVARLEKSAP